MTDTELKPCPFCGKQPVIFPDLRGDEFREWVECSDCEIDIVKIEDWNTRPVEDALKAEVARLTEMISEPMIMKDQALAELRFRSNTLDNRLREQIKENERLTAQRDAAWAEANISKRELWLSGAYDDDWQLPAFAYRRGLLAAVKRMRSYRIMAEAEFDKDAGVIQGIIASAVDQAVAQTVNNRPMPTRADDLRIIAKLEGGAE